MSRVSLASRDPAAVGGMVAVREAGHVDSRRNLLAMRQDGRRLGLGHDLSGGWLERERRRDQEAGRDFFNELSDPGVERPSLRSL